MRRGRSSRRACAASLVLAAWAPAARADEAAVAAYHRREELFDATEVTAAQVARFARPELGLALGWSERAGRVDGGRARRVGQSLTARAVGPWGPSAHWQAKLLRSGDAERFDDASNASKAAADALEARLGAAYRVLDRYLVGAEVGARASETEERYGVGGQGSRLALVYALGAGLRTETLELALGEAVYGDKERDANAPREVRTVSASARWFARPDAAAALVVERGPGSRCCRPAASRAVSVRARWTQSGSVEATGWRAFGEAWDGFGDAHAGIPRELGVGAGARVDVTPAVTLGAELSEAASGRGRMTSARVTLARAL
jgi:hypothetical protein